jgi:acetyltransferase-like isoleucine patch superfamily enzyme
MLQTNLLSLLFVLEFHPHFCLLENNKHLVPNFSLKTMNLNSINGIEDSHLPPRLPDVQADSDLFKDDAWIEPPIHIDYGTNVRLGKGVFLNYNTTIVDTCLVTFGDRTLVGPNCSFYSGTHPLDPALRNGTSGPELGKEIHIEEDCWIGGNVIVCPGVTIGRGSTVGAGSVVTKVSLLNGVSIRQEVPRGS